MEEYFYVDGRFMPSQSIPLYVSTYQSRELLIVAMPDFTVALKS